MGNIMFNGINFTRKSYTPVTKVLNYGFHIDGSKSVPSEMVTYIADSIGMTPAYMDFANGTFNYGSWGDSWFIRDCKPCVLGQNGVVQKYLDKNDYSKDVDGNYVEIESAEINANVMIEFPKIWFKVVPDEGDDTSGSVYISNQKIDDGYKDYSYISMDLEHKNHFYMAAYNTYVDRFGFSRSLSRKKASSNRLMSDFRLCAKRNGDGWDIDQLCKVQLINMLLILISKTTDLVNAFGYGMRDGDELYFNNYMTGELNDKGMFFGRKTGIDPIKIFGIENWWGFQWRLFLGENHSNGIIIKMCYGLEDGSNVVDYKVEASDDEYIYLGASFGGTGDFIKKAKFCEHGIFVYMTSHEIDNFSYYCGAIWKPQSIKTICYFGGRTGQGVKCSPTTINAANPEAGAASWSINAGISYT